MSYAHCPVEMIAKEDQIYQEEFSELLTPSYYKLFDEVSSVVFFVCEMDTNRIVYVSRSSKELNGYPCNQYIDGGLQFFASLIHPEDYPCVMENYVDLIKYFENTTGTGHRETCGLTNEFRIRHDQGHWIWVEVDLVILDLTPRNSIGKVFGTVKNIEEKKKHAETLEGTSTISLQREKEALQEMKKPLNINLQTTPCGKITPRELEVLQLIAHGYSAKQIADKLCISIHTAINHRKNLIEKFSVKNTAELILKASKKYWL